jgi:hypothetical protein
MTLGNMRANGVRTLAIHCGGRWCHHEAILDVSGCADDIAVPEPFGGNPVAIRIAVCKKSNNAGLAQG